MSKSPPPFQRFLDSYREDVWRFLVASVGRGQAEDCFQETFLSALRAYPRLRGDSNMRAWVLKIAHRKAIDAHRARTRGAIAVADIEAVDERASPSTAIRDAELWQAVRRLPSRQRAAVTLRFLADLSHREAAEVIGCSEQAARRSLHEGLVKLRKEIDR